MKIKFTKHPYPESLDADDAPPQLVSFSVSESECEYVYIFYTLDNAAGRAAPARAAGRARGGSGESPDWTKDANCTLGVLPPTTQGFDFFQEKEGEARGVSP